jgi:hypothetical protein
MSSDNRRHLLVLGAGASQPYGFPTGAGLRNDLVKGHVPGACSSDEIIEQTWMTHFRRELRESPETSIDDFIAFRPDYTRVARAEVARIIIGYEYRAADQIAPPVAGDELWYCRLARKICRDLSKDHGQTNVDVITFNYDRSLERRLFVAIKATLHCENEKAYELLAKVNISHVHGSVGSIDARNADRFVPFGVSPSSPDVVGYASRAAGQIHFTANEHVKGGELNARHGSLIEFSRYKSIAVLGFGFIESNVQKLGLDRVKEFVRAGNEFRCSAYGFSENSMRRIAQKLSIDFEESSFPHFIQGKVGDVLRDYPFLLGE